MSEPCMNSQRVKRRPSDTTQFKNTGSYRSTLSYIQRHNTIWLFWVDNRPPLSSNSISLPRDCYGKSAGRRHPASSSVEKCAHSTHAIAALGLPFLHLWITPPWTLQHPGEQEGPRPRVAACLLLRASGTPVRELDPGRMQLHKETEQPSVACTALGTAQTQCWPGHWVFHSPLIKSTMGVLASTWKVIKDRHEETSHQDRLPLLSICFWESLSPVSP